MVSDYSISWSYIVDRMESKFGIKPDSKEKYSMGEIDRNIDLIWDEYFDMLYEQDEIAHGTMPAKEGEENGV